MSDSRMRLMLAAGLMFIMTALSALQTLADAGVELNLSMPAVEGGIALLDELQLLAESEPTPALPSFAERLAAAGSPAALTADAPGGWVPVVPGVDYQYFLEPGPNNVHVARMARANPNLFLETSIGQGRLSGGVERTSSQFARYDEAVNFWSQTWGGTNDVIVAINGSFYGVDGIPLRGMVQSGWYAKRFTNNQNGSGFAWKLDRTTFIGQCIFHMPAKQVVSFISNGGSMQYQGINVPRGDDELIVYTPHFDDRTDTDDDGIEVIVRLDRPTLVLPLPSMAEGTVVAVRDGAGNSKLLFDHIVLSATGKMRAALQEVVEVGDRIGISSSLTAYESDCATPLAVDWTKTYASLGGSYYFLQDGEITSPGPTPANPLTAIAFNDDYIFFIVVDGRDPGISVGMTIDQLAGFVKDTLGAEWGINQDGGGSSTMVIDGVVVNRPSDLSPVDCNLAYLPIVIQGDSEFPGGGAGGEALEGPECFEHTERAVANGIMMVAYQPAAFSGTFLVGQVVNALGEAALRLGPGSNYGVFDTAPVGAEGLVTAHPGGLNGVYAKGTHWWWVDFGGVVGWVAEDVLGP